jgi:hypothetical protein
MFQQWFTKNSLKIPENSRELAHYCVGFTSVSFLFAMQNVDTLTMSPDLPSLAPVHIYFFTDTNRFPYVGNSFFLFSHGE